MVNSDTERSTHCILAAVTLTYGILLIINTLEVKLERVHNLTSLLWQTVLLNKRQNGSLYRGKYRRQLQNHTAVTTLKLLLLVRAAHDREEHTVHTY